MVVEQTALCVCRNHDIFGNSFGLEWSPSNSQKFVSNFLKVKTYLMIVVGMALGIPSLQIYDIFPVNKL